MSYVLISDRVTKCNVTRHKLCRAQILLNKKKKRSKTKTARVFPRLAPVTCICFEVGLVHCVDCVCCDWLLRFYDTQLETKLNIRLHTKNVNCGVPIDSGCARAGIKIPRS